MLLRLGKWPWAVTDEEVIESESFSFGLSANEIALDWFVDA